MTDLTEVLGNIYNEMEGSDVSLEYSERHNVKSAAVLTMTDDETAGLMAEHLAPRIEGKTVIEIGGGIGLLALHMGQYAKRVYCIEANPMWSSVFVAMLLSHKPKNVSFLFGAADEFLGTIKGDVAIYLTHSDVNGMGLVAAQFAPVVIDVYSEMITENPDGFDKTASYLRQFA
jgi:predicted RNA methylase